MCGISGIFGPASRAANVHAMVRAQGHRGPDATGCYADPGGAAALGHARLSIIDLSAAGTQPMQSADGDLWISFNGEIYNHIELRRELSGYPFRTRTDTEVILAAFQRWGEPCVRRFIGMFAFMIWDQRRQRLFAARDRFGVKPFHYHRRADGTLIVASEVQALREAGVRLEPDDIAWATYLASGLQDHSERTFWRGVEVLPAGHSLVWEQGRTCVSRWYDVAEGSGSGWDERATKLVEQEYRDLLEDSVRLRFRSDVPVGINVSGGLDSSTLLALVGAVQGADSEVTAFTFVTGDPNYDELPWVQRLLARTHHDLVVCPLSPVQVPRLACSVQKNQAGPFGGIPTLAYARLFEMAREHGVIVLLDGQGLDEQWAGYDYYAPSGNGKSVATVQGVQSSPVRPECLVPEFLALAQPFAQPKPFPDRLRNLQYRDARHTKLPRALRYNDGVSMRASVELREPFLDHRLFELALRQPAERKVSGGVHKRMLRCITASMLPNGLTEAPKRPLQTPQREWLRGPLQTWATQCIEHALECRAGSWLDGVAVRRTWHEYLTGASDNSFYVWQWVNLGLVEACHD
jgi:asparagine synthase (glutamine-hydrolysing)